MNEILPLLAFLAGTGFPSFVQSLQKLRGGGAGGKGAGQPQAAEGQLPHRAGLRMEASQAPGTTIAPQLLQQLMARQQAGQQGGGQDPLAKLAALMGGQRAGV